MVNNFFRKRLLCFIKNITNLFIMCPLFLLQVNQQNNDNLFYINKITDEIVESVLKKITIDSFSAILIKNQNQKIQGNWILQNSLITKLYERGVKKIFIDQYHDNNKHFVIEYQLAELGVKYFKTDQKNEIKRKIFVEATVMIVDGSSNLIINFDNYCKEYNDNVKIADLKKYELNHYPFTSAPIPKTSNYKKYIEPIIITSVSVGVIYLFFQLRSK